MRTITLQGTKEQVAKVKTFIFNNGSNDRLPEEVETRVYLIDCYDRDTDSMADEEFMKIAKEAGTEYSLEGFQEAFNYGDVNAFTDIIRFINIKI